MLHRRPSLDWSKGYWRKRQVLFSNCKPFFLGIPSVFQCPSAIPRDCLKGVEFVPQFYHLKSLKIHSYAMLAAHWGVAYARKACVFGGPSCLEDSFSKKKSRGKTSWKSEAGVLQLKNFQDPSNLNKTPSPNTLPRPKKKASSHIFFLARGLRKGLQCDQQTTDILRLLWVGSSGWFRGHKSMMVPSD